MNPTFDIDIDVKSHTRKEEFGIRAIIYDEVSKEIRVHPSGVYINDGMRIDPETGYATIDYNDAESRGFNKVDLLTNTVYDDFKTKDEVLETLKEDPNWGLLEDRDVVRQLPHLANHYDLLQLTKPKSVMELADVLALIRPGKIHLIEAYIKDRENTRINLYRRPTNEQYWFKKSHAVAYAKTIIVKMNLINRRDYGWKTMMGIR